MKKKRVGKLMVSQCHCGHDMELSGFSFGGEKKGFGAGGCVPQVSRLFLVFFVCGCWRVGDFRLLIRVCV